MSEINYDKTAETIDTTNPKGRERLSRLHQRELAKTGDQDVDPRKRNLGRKVVAGAAVLAVSVALGPKVANVLTSMGPTVQTPVEQNEHPSLAIMRERVAVGEPAIPTPLHGTSENTPH